MEKIRDFNHQNRKELALMGAIIINLGLGYAYIFGSLSAYITQYYNHKNNTQLTNDDVNIIFPLSMTSSMVGINFSTYLSSHLGSRTIIFSSSLLVFLFLQLSIQFDSFALFVLFYALASFFQGCIYLYPIYISMKYYPKHKGLVCGICMGCYGLSSVILQTVSILIINPENLQVDQRKMYPVEVVMRFSQAIQFLSFYCLVIFVFGSVFLKSKKIERISALDNENLQNENENKNENKNENILESEEHLTVKQSLQSSQFWTMFLLIFLSTSYGYLMLANYKSYGQKYDYDDYYLVFVVGNIASISNGSFRFIFGVICDKIGFKNTYNILVIINIVNSLALDLVASNKFFYALWIFMLASSEGGNFTIFPVYVAQVFGIQKAKTLYSVLLIATNFSNFGQQLILKYMNSSKDWSPLIFYVFTAFNIIALLINNKERIFTSQKQQQNQITLNTSL